MVTTVIDPEYVLGQLSSEEKIALLSGDDMWHTVPIPRLGVPRVRCSDGPVSASTTPTDSRTESEEQLGQMGLLHLAFLLQRV